MTSTPPELVRAERCETEPEKILGLVLAHVWIASQEQIKDCAGLADDPSEEETKSRVVEFPEEGLAKVEVFENQCFSAYTGWAAQVHAGVAQCGWMGGVIFVVRARVSNAIFLFVLHLALNTGGF